MNIEELLKKVHAIKCAETHDFNIAQKSLKSLSELRKLLKPESKDFESELQKWRHEYPEVSNGLLQQYESFKNK